MLILKLTNSANEDLKRLRKFIADKNPLAAMRVSKRLRKAIQSLLKQPLIGAKFEEYPNIREIYVDDYIIRYLISETQLIILRIWHGKEDRRT